jgi:AcrR family transcriptional regulator
MLTQEAEFKINIDSHLFLKDPHSSDLGERIIQYSIILIDEIGFEAFTFKKLAEKINTTEASIYRYFENKQKLLLYLFSWYWNWMELKILYATHNIISAQERLKAAIELISEPIVNDHNFKHVDETALYKIVISESAKVYLSKNVDVLNKLGLFKCYKRLCKRVADIVLEINPDYKYSRALISTVMESAHSQKYFSEHLPSLTEIPSANQHLTTEFLTELVFSAIRNK